MRIRITRNTVAEGRPVMAGEVLDLSSGEGALLVAMRKAEEIKAEPETIANPASDPGQAGETPRPSPGLTTQSAAAIVAKFRRRRKPEPEK